jgi:sugar O-acyltransferase (sialic acid O-acetyltransferase NeuD family)
MATNTQPLVIIGTGGQGRCALEIARQCGRRVLGFVDALNPDNVGTVVNGVPVIAVLAELDDTVTPGAAEVIVAYGDNPQKKHIADSLADRHLFGRLISPDAVVADGVPIGEGSVIYPTAVVQTNARLGRHVKVGPTSVVSHDNIIGDFVNITTGCSMGGYVTLEEGVAVNTGANIVPRVTVGAWTVVGAAALVMNDVAGGLVVIGAPAQPLRPAD